eukprot:scaffold17350_cov52-Phaeocystis_antarctica.AAC.1
MKPPRPRDCATHIFRSREVRLCASAEVKCSMLGRCSGHSPGGHKPMLSLLSECFGLARLVRVRVRVRVR